MHPVSTRNSNTVAVARVIGRCANPGTATDRYAYSSIGGQEQIKLRSPYGLSIRPTLGQCLLARTNGSGNAACSREYGCGQSAAVTAPAVCGAFFSTLSRRSAVPSITA